MVFSRKQSSQKEFTEASSARRGGVAIVYREAEQFSVEELRLHGLNVVSFQLVTRRRQ